ncbi:MAG: Sel1 domain protein repeat-containing protein [Cyanobacteria bacterium RYN_339]|nr:Sel1 domain protein repeat-containing protein [Cyanobacteria bacterium RYN_339]
MALRARGGAHPFDAALGSWVVCEDRALLYEEAPQAYKDIDVVVGDLVDAGRPVMTPEAALRARMTDRKGAVPMTLDPLETAAQAGDADAQLALGSAYMRGQGVAKDAAVAARWFRAAADQGLANAQYNVGLCYDHGAGVAEDFAEAATWYARAAEQGHPGGLVNLGVCYQTGAGVAQDTSRAAGCYKAAADQGYPNAEYNLGVCYMQGIGVTQNVEVAVEWITRAAEQGYPQAVAALKDIVEAT